MRKAALLSGLFFFLTAVGVAEAGTITPVGAVKALTNVSQVLGTVGTGGFDEGPTTGAVPVNVYAALGLTWRTGTLSSILPGVTNTGSGTQPQYSTFSYFPAPIGGGGTHVGQSNFFAGVATFVGTAITQVGLTASSNGTQYLTAFNAAGQMIGQVTWTPAADSAFVGIDTLGVPIAMIAYGNHDLWSGAPYGVGGATIISDSWIWASGKCSASAQCSDGNACTDDVCNISGACVHVNNTAACNDGNACTAVDVCAAGMCVGTSPVTCTAMDQCHTPGICAPGTGICTNPAKADGTTCSDSNTCTQTDTCQAGACTGASPVACPQPDACHTAGTCNPGTGICTNPAKADGTACSDSNACTQTDTCQAGACTGASPVVCAPIDGCHDTGICDMATGMCSTPVKADGATCNDSNPCTQTDTCAAGVCVGANPKTCTAMDSCHDVGMCDMASGLCTNPSKADGVACSDNNACTQTDTCAAGVCIGANPKTCTAMDACHDVGTCDMASGACSNPAKADGVTCSDNNACTQTDTCKAGVCTGENPKTCAAMDSCHDMGTCDVASGNCSNPLAVDGTACPGGGTCSSGMCNVPEAAAPDAGSDSGSEPGTMQDASMGDGGATDDGAPENMMTDASTGDGGPPPFMLTGEPMVSSSGGCGCGIAGSGKRGFGVLGLGLLAMLFRRRSRR